MSDSDSKEINYEEYLAEATKTADKILDNMSTQAVVTLMAVIVDKLVTPTGNDTLEVWLGGKPFQFTVGGDVRPEQESEQGFEIEPDMSVKH